MAKVFVYGANERGIHGKGSALEALINHGAVRGRYGRVGSSYGIPTKASPWVTLSLAQIEAHVASFIEHALANPEDEFHLVPIGCGNAGYTPAHIAPLFADVPRNVVLPPEFLAVLNAAKP